MTRILVVETASPKRVRRKAEDILRSRQYPNPELTVLCRPEASTVQYFKQIPGARVLPLERIAGRDALRDLKRTEFDVLWMFWTRDRGYLRMKWLALRVPALFRHVDIGDGNNFKLSRGNLAQFLLIRLRSGRPADFGRFELEPGLPVKADDQSVEFDGERVLILQSAEPLHILNALDRLKEHPLFTNARYTLFCRNRLEAIQALQGHPMLHRILTHSETKGVWRHLRTLRRVRYDALVFFLTGDPSYWKMKCFAFLLGARNKVIFNECNDCFYFTLRTWLVLLSRRREDQLRTGRKAAGQCTLPYHARLIGVLVTKTLLLPFRFLWLLFRWLHLRVSALGESS